MTRRIRFLILPLALAPLTLLGAPAEQTTQTNAALASKASASSTNTLVAKGKGLEIWRSDLDREVTHALAQAAANGHRLDAEQMPTVERQVLEQIIDFRLLAAKATPAEKAEAKAAAEKRYATTKAKMGSDAAFDVQLKFLATTREELIAKWTEALTAQAVLKRELKINITDQEAKKFFEDNPEQFDLPEKVHVRHILVATRDLRTGAELSDEQKAAKRKRAEGVLKRARAGEDFAVLAMAFSNDLGSRAKGGEYEFARGQLVPEVENAAFAMQTNQISDIVTSKDGYHIIKLLEKIPAHKVTYAAAAADIKESLALQAIDRQPPEYLPKLRKEAEVEILDERLKPIDPGLEPGGTPSAPAKRPG
jgi:peptidyl-prolyl cis-trans isomerase C